MQITLTEKQRDALRAAAHRRGGALFPVAGLHGDAARQFAGKLCRLGLCIDVGSPGFVVPIITDAGRSALAVGRIERPVSYRCGLAAAACHCRTYAEAATCEYAQRVAA